MTFDEFKKDGNAQRKFFIVAGVLAVGIGWLWFGGESRRAGPMVMVRKPPAVVVKAPAPATVAPPPPAVAPAPVAAVITPPAPAVAAAPPPPDPMANVAKTFVGTWAGRATVNQAPDSRVCDMGIEVKRQDKDKDAAPFDVFVNLNCTFQNGRNPPRRDETSFVLSGAGHDGVVPFITLETVSNIGVAESAFHCSMRSMKLSSFGDLGRVSGSWSEEGGPSCKGGEIVMQRKRWF
jgi:hypothetical protein